jgi:hypothetical protein
MRAVVAGGPGGAPTLDANRKLAVINGMGDHSRAQGNSSAVKEAIGACCLGASVPRCALSMEHRATQIISTQDASVSMDRASGQMLACSSVRRGLAVL